MESKTVILSLVMLSLVLAQFQVEGKSCCPSTSARNIYNSCRLTGASRPTCASLSGCKIQDSPTCVLPYIHVENSGDVMKLYCKVGCTSSVCNVNANAYGTVANEALDQCINICSKFCGNAEHDNIKTAIIPDLLATVLA